MCIKHFEIMKDGHWQKSVLSKSENIVARANFWHLFKNVFQLWLYDVSYLICMQIIILWHVDPLLGNNHKIRGYTTVTAK
jgi:hypothetical protein